MRKLPVVLFVFLAVNIFAQQNVSAPQKFALVIGNGNYTSFGSLPNAVNDASDMADTLQSLGFTVDKVLNGTRVQMVEAITRLKGRLSASNDSYGFLFYAGHGVQFNGINYLIPATADIPSANYLGDTAISVQTMLAELNDAGNELNVVVLDACRDFPAAWSRSTNRGLTVITNQPADSIIVYATSAGSTASDGTGRNGLFTSQLLKNLKTPGLEVSEVFRRTGADVSTASHRLQIPAVYNQYFGIAYLGQPPAEQPVANAPVQPEQAAAPVPQPPAQPVASAPVEPAPPSPGSNDGRKFAIGVKAGVRFEAGVGSANNFKTPQQGQTGFYASLYGAYAFTSLFSLQPGLAISLNNGFLNKYQDNDTGNTITEDIQYSSLDFPILSAFTFHPSQIMLIRLSIGPMITLALTDAQSTITSTGSPSLKSTYSFNDLFSFGLLGDIGVGFSMGRGNIFLDIRAFINYKQDISNKDRIIHNGLPVLLGGYEYWFK